MKLQKLFAALAVACGCVYSALAFTTGTVPADGIYKFAFGSNNNPEGYTHVDPDAVYDASHQYKYADGSYTYGFLGTQDDSYKNDKPWSLPADARLIDGFSVVSGQYIELREMSEGIAGPLMENYQPAGASKYEGRYPVRFSFSAEAEAYYAVTCTVVNVSSTEAADVTLLSERCHIQAHHLTLKPGETRTFAWSVELWPNVMKSEGTYTDDAINVVVAGVNAGLKSLVAVREPQTTGTIRGIATDKMNVGKTMWLCDDSTGTDQAASTPFFSLQNYSGVGSGLSRWAPANLSIRNQGEGGLATSADPHRKSCMLKPGDYLYVEYGHNENAGVTVYTNNLERYFTDITNANAKLIIVSPVERRTSWNSETQTWGRSLAGIATAGEAWVEDKIAQGYKNVAFIDLNKTYNDWQNTEIVRIHNVAPDTISLNAAISFYYRSAKGANVDNTHINTAGTDQAAYWVWYDALRRVAAGKAEGATQSQQVQAAVLEGITEGYQDKVGVGGTEDNLPWNVSDDIIKAGVAPNSFWDTPVTSGYDYVNDANISSVDAVANADGTVTITNITMRILNPGNYYKTVVDIVYDEDGETRTNRWYSFCNYDIGGAGKMSGDLVTPASPGFLNGDKANDAVTGPDSLALTIPAGGKAYAWVAVADAGTWQVGENGPCSPKYPIEWWSEVIFENDCSNADDWTVLSQAVNTKSVTDGALYFTSSGADAGNTKKNFGMYRALDADVAGGRYRISFMAKIDAGSISYTLGDAVNTTTTLFKNNVSLLQLTTSSVVGYQKTSPLVTLLPNDDGTTTPQARANTSAWVDVDMIIDRDNARAWISVGGSDYVEWTDTTFLPNTFSGRTWKYFGITTPGQTSTYGYVDEVRILKLAPVTYPTVTIKAAPSDAAMGSVTINGSAVNTLTTYAGRDVLLQATAANKDYYKFDHWQDAEGNEVSTKANLYLPAQTESLDYTAVFTAYGEDDPRVITWDFSDYQGDFAVSGKITTNVNQNMSFVLTASDALTGTGLKWANSANNKTATTMATDKYIVYTPAADGTLSITFSADAITSNRNPTVVVNAAASKSECDSDKAFAKKAISATNTVYTFTANLTAGQTYYIWPYSYNWSGAKFNHNYTVSEITYTYEPTYYTCTAAAEGQGTAAVSAARVISGGSVTFTAKPHTTAYKFTAWTSADGTTNSTDAVYTPSVTSDLALTANFELRAAGEEYTASVDFAHAFAGSAAVTATANTLVTNGVFVYHLASGDKLTSEGIYFPKEATQKDSTAISTRYIEFTAPVSGTATLVFQSSRIEWSENNNKYIYPAFYVCTNDTITCKNSFASISVGAAKTDTKLTFAVEAGVRYFLFPYFYNRTSEFTVSSITYSDVIDPVTLTVSASPAASGTFTLNGFEQDTIVAQKGEYVLLSATATEGSALVNWTDEEGAVLSADSTYCYVVKASETVTANFSGLYTWTGNAGDGLWATLNNWNYMGATATTAPTLGTDAIYFNNDAVVKPDTDHTLETLIAGLPNVTINGSLTFNCTSQQTLNQAEVNVAKDIGIMGSINVKTNLTGTGIITFKGATILNESSGATRHFGCPVCFEEGTTNKFQCTSKTSRFQLDGAVSGYGHIGLTTASKYAYGGIIFTGDMSKFYGTADLTIQVASGLVRFTDNATNMAHSAWQIFYTSGYSSNNSFLLGKTGTYVFGALDIVMPNYSNESSAKNSWVEVGALNEDSHFSGSFNALSNKESIRWTATDATLHTTTTNTYELEITNGGEVDFDSVATGIPSVLTITGKGGYIKYASANFAAVTNVLKVENAPLGWDVPAGETCVFDDYGFEGITGLMKKGEGTLSVPEGTVFAALPKAQQANITIIGMNAETEMVKFTTLEDGTITVSKTERIDEVPLFLVGGQSNTDGRIPNSGDNAIPSEYTSNDKAKVMTGTNSFLEAWAPCSGDEGQASKWAYDTPLYYYLTRALSSTIYVAKTSYGGTSVNPYVSNSGSGTGLPQYGAGYHWSADPTFLAATKPAGETFVGTDGVTYTGQSLLLKWINNMDAAIDALKADHKSPVVKAIVWHQGESDKNNGNYASELHDVVTYVRKHLAEKLGDASYLNLPFFCGNVPKKSSLYTVNLDKQFTTVAETTDWNMHVADIYDMTMLSDVKHFTGPSAITFAKRMFNQMVDTEVIDAEKLEVTECVRKPDFTTEFVVNNETTWLVKDLPEVIAFNPSLTCYDGMYFHGYNSSSRQMKQVTTSEYSLEWTIGKDTTATTTAEGLAVNSWWNYTANVLTTTSAADTGTKAAPTTHMIGVNVGRAGTFEMFVAAKSAVQLLFNGTVVAESAASDTTALVHLTASNTTEGTYYLAVQNSNFLGARFVPTEEQTKPITVTIPSTGVATFGNLYNCSLVLPDGLTAYAANVDASDNRLLALTQVAAINLGDAVILKGAAGSYTLTPGIGASYTTENLMVAQEETGVVGATSGDDFINFLVGTDEDGNVTLVKSTGTTELAAGEAFFSITEGDAHSTEPILYEVLPPVEYTEEVADGVTTNVIAAYAGSRVTLNKTGAGTMVMQGPNTFAGKVKVNEGTLKLGTVDLTSITKFDFDASDTKKWSFNADGTIKTMQSANGTTSNSGYSYMNSYGDATSLITDGDYFGEQPFVWLTSGSKFSYGNVKTSRANSYGFVYVVQKPTDPEATEYINHCGNASDADWITLTTSGWNGSKGTSCIYVNGANTRTFTAGEPEVVVYNARVTTNDNRFDQIGDTFEGALAEYIGFSSTPSVDEAKAISMKMMWKWNFASKNDMQSIPSGAAVSVASGATLDIGTYTDLQVASLTLEDGAVIALDALPESGLILTVTDAITINGTVWVKIGDETATPDKIVRAVAGDDVWHLEITDPTYVKLTVPTVANAKATVTAGGAVRTPGDDGTYEIPTGVKVTVEYTGVPGYGVTNGTIEYASLTEDTSVVTTDVTVARVATTYTWSGAGANAKWRTVANWKVGAEDAVEYPSTLDTAVFPVCAAGVTNSVTMDTGVTVPTVVLEGDLWLTGANKLSTDSITGDGMLYMNGAYLSATTTKNLVISNDITFVEGTYSYIYMSSSRDVELRGNLHGKGSFQSYQAGNYNGTCLYGDNRDFEGVMTVHDGSNSARDCSLFDTPEAVSEKASYTLEGTTGGNSRGPRKAGTYKFGTLKGGFYNYTSSVILEVGARNENCAFTSYGDGSKYDKAYPVAFGLRKVGSATLTYTGTTGLADVAVEAGTLVVTNQTSFEDVSVASGATLTIGANRAAGTSAPTAVSLTLADGAIIDVDYAVEGLAVITTTGGVTTNGTMVLKVNGVASTSLKLAVSEDGKSLVVASAGPEVKPGEGTITPQEDGTYEVETASTNVTEVTISNLPAEATVKVPVNVETVNGVTDVSKVKVLGGDTAKSDITKYLTITTTATGVTIGDLPTSGTVYEEIEATTLDDAEPIKLEGGKAEITTGTTIKGLKYTLVEGKALNDMGDGDSTYGNGAAWTPEVGKSGKLENATSGFFKIRVSK